jgi:hypothetical protein
VQGAPAAAFSQDGLVGLDIHHLRNHFVNRDFSDVSVTVSSGADVSSATEIR